MALGGAPGDVVRVGAVWGTPGLSSEAPSNRPAIRPSLSRGGRCQAAGLFDWLVVGSAGGAADGVSLVGLGGVGAGFHPHVIRLGISIYVGFNIRKRRVGGVWVFVFVLETIWACDYYRQR